MIAAILTLIIAVGCRAIAELQQHGKLKWSTMYTGFWDQRSWNRKYKWDQFGQLIKAPESWYYKTLKIKYKEKFPLSATLLVFLTDGYHLSQFAYHVFLALSFSLFSGYSFWWFWIGIVAVHATVYRLLSK